MPLTALNPADRKLLEKRFGELRKTELITSKRVSDLIAEWEPKVKPDAMEKKETFTLVYPSGKSAGVSSPRWLCHLLGLRHKAVHIAFRTEAGLVAMQRRSCSRPEWPDMLDMAVSGHVPQNFQGHDLTYEEGAWKEIEEELGLVEKEAAQTLVEGKLTPIGDPYFTMDLDPRSNPPFYNAEARQIYVATLTGAGLSKIRFNDGEVAGLTFVTPETAWDILGREQVASGLRYSLPRVLEWVESQPIIRPFVQFRGLSL
jgi:isopentenyldiphosphate isomerase